MPYQLCFILFGEGEECFSLVDRLLVSVLAVLRGKFSTQHLHDLSFILNGSVSSVSYVGFQAFQSSKTTACTKLELNVTTAKSIKTDTSLVLKNFSQKTPCFSL